VSGRPFPRFGGHPGKPTALFELDHVILPDAALGERHREDSTRAADALPGGCHTQVVVAIPAWLLSRIGDQLEDPPWPSRDLTAGADHARRLLPRCHVSIQAPAKDAIQSARGGAPRPTLGEIVEACSGGLLWLIDITEHPTGDGKLYCAAVMDAYSRRIIGWSIDARQDTDLVVGSQWRPLFGSYRVLS
jgi:hypothetical protein